MARFQKRNLGWISIPGGSALPLAMLALLVTCQGVASSKAPMWDRWNGVDWRSVEHMSNERPLTDSEKQAKIKRFPFVKDAIRLRLNQSFFDLGTEALEEILKTAGILEPETRTLAFSGTNIDLKSQKPMKNFSWLQYKYLKSKIRLRNNAFSVFLDTQIVDAIIYKDSWNITDWNGRVVQKCRIRMQGKLQMQVDSTIENGRDVRVVVSRMTTQGFRMAGRGCNNGIGQSLTEWGISSFGPGQLQSNLQEVFSKLLNSDEVTASFAIADFGKAMEEKGIYVNRPSLSSEKLKTNRSRFKVEVGIAGAFSNSKGRVSLRVGNPYSKFVNSTGLEWTLSSGFQALSKNIHGLKAPATKKHYGNQFSGWGVAPFNKTGQRISFDAAVAVSEEYMGSLFNSLFDSGFFNWQVSNEAEGREYSIDPMSLRHLFELKLPNGQQLSTQNHNESRLEMAMLQTPGLGLQDDHTIVLTVPRFRLAYHAQIAGLDKEHSLLDFEAQFRLKARLVFTEDAQFKVDFDDHPIHDFKVLDRSRVAERVKDEHLFETLNAEVSRILSDVAVDIPLLKGRKLDLQYIGIDGNAQQGKFLSVYLKVSHLPGQGGGASSPMR